MNATLPDINVWLVLLTGTAPQHARAVQWFETQAASATAYLCRVTQLGILRMLTQRAVMGSAVLTQRRAWQIYTQLRSDPRVAFADEPPNLDEVFRAHSSREEVAPKRWTDDYLLAFAEAANLTLVTFDRALAARTPNSVLLET